jgi:hypothetical protein
MDTINIPLEFFMNKRSYIDSKIDYAKIHNKLMVQDSKYKDCYEKSFSTCYPDMMIKSGTDIEKKFQELYAIEKCIDYLCLAPINNAAWTNLLYKGLDESLRLYNMDNYYDNDNIIFMKESDIINDYQLYPSSKPFLRQTEFYELVELWNTNKKYTYDEFYSLYDSTACHDWYKIDKNGDSVNYSEQNRTNSGDLLWKLPYPKQVVLKTIEIGCGPRLESVRFSNFLCEWIKRKMDVLCLNINQT